MKRTFFVCVLGALSVWGASAQEERRQAVITGRSGSPKCTIEVEVDEVADVEIQGSVARLHTLKGGPATWRRFECNQPMPPNPSGFRFQGIDGRGRQTLIGDPQSSGAAVVRIEDPKAGREGYTFDIQWDGLGGPVGGRPGMANGYPQPGYPQAGNPQPGYPQAPFPGGDRDRDRDRDGRFGPEEASRQCSEAARDQLRRNSYSDARVTDVKMDGEPGRGDWIYGTLSAQRGARVENFKFACSVDFQARRVGAVNVRVANDGYYGRDAERDRYSREGAFRACREAVQERLRRNGYTDFNISRMDMDDRSGNNDSIVGGLAAQRDGYSDNFEFSCSIDFDGGQVRSINVNRR